MSMDIDRPSAPAPSSPSGGGRMPTLYLSSPRSSTDGESPPSSPFAFHGADFVPATPTDSNFNHELLRGKVVHLRPIPGRSYAPIPRRKRARNADGSDSSDSDAKPPRKKTLKERIDSTTWEDDSRSDMDVEVISRPATPDSDDDDFHREWRLKLAEDRARATKSPLPTDNKKMFMEDWIKTVDNGPGPWMGRPLDPLVCFNEEYPPLPVFAVAMEGVTEDGHRFEGWLRYFYIPYVCEVDAKLVELGGGEVEPTERLVGSWLIPSNPLDGIDRERPDEQTPKQCPRGKVPCSEDVDILPQQRFFGPWVPADRHAQEEARRNKTFDNMREELEQIGTKTSKGSFGVYRVQNDGMCGEKEWYQQMSEEEKDVFAAQDMFLRYPRVCRLELRPTRVHVEREVD